VLFWGFIASVQASVTSWAGLMACRFFLGVAEAAYGPGVPLYLTYFYPREKVGFRHGIFIAAAALANAYGGALAYGISQINGGLAPWRILFLIEGLPTCVFALVPFFFLPDSIAQATFLDEREREVAYHFVARNQRLDVDKNQGVRLKEMFEGIKDPKSYLPGLMYFSVNVSFASLPLFVPTIIEELGIFTTIQSNGLSAPPYLLCFFYIIFICWCSDHFKMRGPFCALTGVIGAIGFIINATSSSAAVRYFSIFLSVQIFAAVSLLLAWTANIHATESKRAGGYTVLATLGQCGPLLGTNIYPESDSPRFQTGLWVSAAFCLLIAVVSTILSFWLIHENKVMDREGVPAVQEFEDTSVARPTGEHEKHHYIW
jgi:MFS family permease